jgi:CheY-like chemotaxis protein
MLAPKTRLLIVDADALVCRKLSIIFSALGYATRSVPSGFLALNAIRDEIPDILLSDLYMPGMSGFELLSVVRRGFPSIRVIAMSGKFEDTTLPPGVAADAFYQKGYQRPRLLLGAVEAMTRPQKSQAVRFPLRSDAPIWIPDPSGEPLVAAS